VTTPITGETWGDEIDGVRAFILDEATQPFSALMPRLVEARQTLLAALVDVDETQAQFRPDTGEGEDAWGIAEVLRHIASIEAIMAHRIRLLGRGEPVDVTATYPGYMEDVSTRSLPELLDALAESYALLEAAVSDIDGHERLDTLEPHRRFGELNCRGWLVMHRLHIEDHARQVGKIKAMPGFPGVSG
jgi:hypothetical protein